MLDTEGHGMARGRCPSGDSPTKADAKRVNPMARGACEPCPGLVTAVAYTTDTCRPAGCQRASSADLAAGACTPYQGHVPVESLPSSHGGATQAAGHVLT